MKRTINITIECENDEQAFFLEQHIRDNYDVKSCTWLPDEGTLYEDDPGYRKMKKELKENKTALYDYIKLKTQ